MKFSYQLGDKDKRTIHSEKIKLDIMILTLVLFVIAICFINYEIKNVNKL